MALCEPKIELSICDSNVKIGEGTGEFTLIIHKGNKRICNIDLSDIAGDIVLTDAEILEFATEGQTFKLQLRDVNNAPVELMYKDCTGQDAVAETIRLTFMECDAQNDFLYEIC